MSSNELNSSQPSADERCPECGELVGHEWISYRRDPAEPQALRWHIGGIVRAEPRRRRGKRSEEPTVEPASAAPVAALRRENVREFRYPDDLNVFFHQTCAPKVRLPEKLERELVSCLADLLVKDLLMTHGSWEGVQKALASGEPNDSSAMLEPVAATVKNPVDEAGVLLSGGEVHRYERRHKSNARDVINYEIDMMEHSASRVLEKAPDLTDNDQFLYLEAFLLHFRILLEFFGKPDKRYPDNLYFQKPETCEVDPPKEVLAKTRKLAASLHAKWGPKLNKFLAHPTEPRYTTSRDWTVEEMREEMRGLVSYWRDCGGG